MDSRGKALVAIFLALLAVALTGTDTPGLGFAEECIDGIDNDGDLGADYDDQQCSEYPYEDGNAESSTNPSSWYLGDYYEVSYFHWRFQYSPLAGDLNYFCDPYQVSGDPGSEMANYQLIQTSSNQKDSAADDYRDWFYANCP